MEPTEVKRVYVNSDSKMAESARTIFGLLTTDIAAFTAFDSTINAVFLTAYESIIDDADTVVADSAVIDQLVTKTENVLSFMDQARSKYRDVKYFVQKAFPNSVGIQGEFGLNDYQMARRSTSQMIQFLDEMHNAATKYSAELIAAGYNLTEINDIAGIREKLQDGNFAQEVFKKERPKLTEDRIIILNKCYNMMMLVNAAGQLVFREDYAKQKQYVYSPTPGGDDDADEEEFDGTVAPASSTSITTVDESAVLILSNTGTVPLIFGITDTDTFNGHEVTLAAGATVTKSSEDLDPDGVASHLVVKNESTTVTGSYVVQIEI